MASNGNGPAIFYTVAVTLAGVAVSYAVTTLILGFSGHGFVPIAAWLSIGIPAIMAPITMFPLLLMLYRQRALRHELERMAHTDALTGLPNRRAFFAFAENLMEQEIAPDMPATAMMIDVDHFKAINDTRGHDAGDVVLRRVAAVIRDAVRQSTTGDWAVARLGGEEFAVLLDGIVPSAVARLADRICLDVRQVILPDEGQRPVTVSIGVAFRARGMGIDGLLKLADDAVYAAKNNGRDRWAFAGERQASQRSARPLPEPANDRRAFG